MFPQLFQYAGAQAPLLLLYLDLQLAALTGASTSQILHRNRRRSLRTGKHARIGRHAPATANDKAAELS